VENQIVKGQLRVIKPKYAPGVFYTMASIEDHLGSILPVIWEEWIGKARAQGWKMLSRSSTDTSEFETEIWELPREQWQV